MVFLAQLEGLQIDLLCQLLCAKSKYEANHVNYVPYHNKPKLSVKHLNHLQICRSSSASQTVSLTFSHQIYNHESEPFKHFFNSVLTTREFFSPTDKLPSPSSQLSSICISESDIFKYLSNLDHSRLLAVIGNIYPIFQKLCATSLLPAMTKLISCCPLHHNIHLEIKVCKSYPMYIQKGDQSVIKNYGPISFLCVQCAFNTVMNLL